MLASPMDPNLLQKFHNIRGVTTANDETTPLNNTVGSVWWDWIASNYDAGDSSPIHDGGSLPGDGTQPAWTACLAGNARCITVKGSKIDHSFLMNDTGVLNEIQGILCQGGGAVIPTETLEPEPAADDEIVEFLKWLSQHLHTVRRMKRFDDPEFRALLRSSGFERRLPNIARRFISDVMKRPGAKGLRPPDDGGQQPRTRPKEPTPSRVPPAERVARKKKRS
jgi:hypothetical protein